MIHSYGSKTPPCMLWMCGCVGIVHQPPCIGVISYYMHHNKEYSGTPLFRTSEMQTTRFNGYFAPAQIVFPLTAIHYNPWNADTPLFRKVDTFFGSFSTWTVQNSLDNADAHLPLTQGCPPLLINSTTRHYNNSTGIHSISLWSAFLASV